MMMIVDDDVDDDEDTEGERRLFDPEWDVLTNEYEQVDWKKIEGQNFMSKMEMLLGCLTKTNFTSSSSSSTAMMTTSNLPATGEKGT